MESLVRRSIEMVRATARVKVPWELDKPYAQPYYSWSASAGTYNGEWQAQSPSTREDARPAAVKSIMIYSWNIDFMLPFPDSRMRIALRQLEDRVSRQDASTATVIFLSECLHSDLRLITSDPWVQRAFHITDTDGSYWQSGHYGTTTLIDRRLSIESCFRVHYEQTRMERDALFVDVNMGKQGKPVRLCNTHLESLALDPPLRPLQMQLCAHYMHDSAVDGAVLAGDLNAIQDFDRRLHSDSDLKDAYLEFGGTEDDAEAGHTWGQQAATAQRQKFGTSRMDKVFFCGGVVCTAFERFGAGIELQDEGERQEILKLGFDRPWITDHLGVRVLRMAGIGPAFFDRLPRSPEQQEGPPPLDQGGVPVSPGFDQLPRSPGQQERPPLLGQGTVPAFPASGFTSRHKYLPFGAPPIPGSSPLFFSSSNNPLASQPPRTQSVPGRTCPSIGILGGPSPGGVLPPGSSLPMPSSSLLPNPRRVQAGLGQAPSSFGYLGNISFSGLLPHGTPLPPPHKPWDCDPPLPRNSPLRGKFDWGPPLPRNSPLRQLWGQRLSVQTPPRAQSARTSTGPTPLSATGQPTSLQPVMLPCVTTSLPLSQTAAASKAGPQELAKSSRIGDDALVRGPVLYDIEPKYRRGPAVPIGKGIELNGQRLEPTHGQQGYGIYAPSSEENVIDFYPVNGSGLSSQGAPFQAPAQRPAPVRDAIE
ncbi:hypothetical protein KC361_g2886 [Hortaea werneckii]|nr:hypothetical protein KC361_g2886 [Hortaea werneckii]